MALTAVGLSSLAVLLALLPLLPGTSLVSIVLAALGLVPASTALGLSLVSRTRALQAKHPLRLPTLALVLSCVASVLCLCWLLLLLAAALHFRSAPVAGTSW